MKAEILPCRRCGIEPVRTKKKMHRGKVRWRISCPQCRRATKPHFPNGGDIEEWNAMNQPLESKEGEM